MSEFISHAFIDIRPETGQFREKLKTEIDSIVKRAKFNVPVGLDPKGFKKAIQDEAKKTKAKVLIEPDFKVGEFRKAIVDGVNKAKAGIKAKIPVEVQATAKPPTQAAAATRKTAATAPKTQIPVEPQLNVAEFRKSLLAKIEKAKEGIKIQIPVEILQPTQAKVAKTGPVKAPKQPEPKLPKETAAAVTPKQKVSVAVGTDFKIGESRKDILAGLNKAKEGIKGRIPVVAELKIQESRKAILAGLEQVKRGIKGKIQVEVEPKKTKGFTDEQAGRIARGKGSVKDFTSLALGDKASKVAKDEADASDKAERSTTKRTEAQKRAVAVTKALSDAQKQTAITTHLLASADQKELSVEEKTQRLRDARVAANNAVRKTTEQLAGSQGKLSDKQKIALGIANAEALATRSKVIEAQKEFTKSTQIAAVLTKGNKARETAADLVKRDVASIKSLNTLHGVENDLLAAEARLKTNTNKARDLGLSGRVKENQKTLQEIEAQKQAIVVQRDELKGQGKRALQQKTAIRGAGATILSILGLRGATLAANAAFLAGAAASALFTKSLGGFAVFERELNTFQAVAGASADQMKEVSRVAQELGADITLPAVSAADAAQAMTELARAGLSVRESIAGARGVLELAAAAQIDNAEAANLVASALNAFGLSGSRAIHVADLLANAANAAQGSISEMGAAMQQATAIAHQVGLSLDNTIAILTQFAQHGLRGSDAGTSLRTALTRLIAPTKDASELLHELGIHVRDAQGNIRPDIFVQFGQATKDLAPALRDSIAEAIAGQDAIRAFAIGGQEGARGLKLVQLQMEQEGAAARVAAARTKGVAGAFGSLGSNVETLGVELGKFAAGPVAQTTTALNEMITSINSLIAGDFNLHDVIHTQQGERSIATASKRLEGLKDTFLGLRSAGQGFGFGSFTKGISELTKGAETPTKKIERLNEQLEALNRIRVQKFELHLPIAGVTKDLKEVQRQLREEGIKAGDIVPLNEVGKAFQQVHQVLQDAVTAKTELKVDTPQNERTIKQIKARLSKAGEIRAEIKSKGGDRSVLIKAKADTSAVDTEIANLRKRLLATLTGTRADIEKILTGKGLAKSFKHQFDLIAETPKLATPEVLAGIQNMVAKIKTLSPVAGKEGANLAKKVASSLQAAIDAAVKADNPDLAAALKAKAEAIAKLFGIQFADAFKNIKVPLTGDQIAEALLPFDIDISKADAFGTAVDQIAAHQKKLDQLNKDRKSGKFRKGSQEEKDNFDAITSEQEAIASLKEGAASKIKEANDKADAAFDKALSRDEQKRQNALTVAQTTETLADDIAAEKKLRAFYLAKVIEVRRTVKDAEKAADEIATLNQNLFEVNQDIAKDTADRRKQIRDERLKTIDDAAERAGETETLQDDLNVANRKVRFWRTQVKNLKKLVKERKATADELKQARDDLNQAEDEADKANRERRQQQRDRRAERLDLRIQIAQDTGNRGAEIRAREAQIKNTEKLIKQTRRGSLQRLRLIAELRKEQRELRDLKAETKKAADAAKNAQFEFLQMQHGFAANLLGNLIPLGAAGGTVGNVSPAGTRPGKVQSPSLATGGIDAIRKTPLQGTAVGDPGERIRKSAAVAEGRKIGPTKIGQDSELHLLREIRTLLRLIHRGNAHPEAAHRRHQNATALNDYGHSGQH